MSLALNSFIDTTLRHN